jgi:transcriptional regulator with XRE-family HTH domain
MDGEELPGRAAPVARAPGLTELGRAIARLRRALDLSDADFAGITSIPLDRLRAIEAGDHDPGFADLCVVAAALGLGPDELVVEARRER